MIYLWWSLGGLAALIAIMTVIGATFPQDHSFTGTESIGRPPAEVWATITDFAHQTAWNPLVKGVERQPDRDGKEVWRELSTGSPPMTLVTLESEASRRLVRSIDDEKKVFSGRWTFELEPADGGTAIRITEDATVKNPFFRFMVRMVGPGQYIRRYLAGLKSKLG